MEAGKGVQTVGFRRGACSKTPFAMLNYSFTAANDASGKPISHVYLILIANTAHSIVNSIHSIKLQVLLTVSEVYL